MRPALALSLLTTAACLAVTGLGPSAVVAQVDDPAGAPAERSVTRPSALRVLSAQDHDIFARAFDAADRGDWNAAQTLARQGNDPLARRLIQWRYLLDRNSGASLTEIDAFLIANPNWPARDVLLTRAEAAIAPDMRPADIVTWFSARAPVSPIGRVRLGEALAATGRADTGAAMIRQGWIEGSFDPAQELAIAQRDAAYLTPETDRARLDALLWRDDIAGARRQMARVDDATQRVAQARVALRSGGTAAQRAVDALPASAANDQNVLFDRARAARRAGDDPTAAALLQRIDARAMARRQPARWWAELNITSRDILQAGNPRLAYALVRDTGLTAGASFADAEFLAGWLALTQLNDPRAALNHFTLLDGGVTRPISKSRARYWKGRAYEALGDGANAYAQYRLASMASDTFYGQVALARIETAPTLRINAVTITPDAATRAAFEAEEMTRVIRILADLGQEGALRTFVNHDVALYADARHQRLLMDLLTSAGFRELSVRMAKALSYEDKPLPAYTHPVIAVPPYRGKGAAPEDAVVLALIRQETEFDAGAISAPGAMGIMQIMPATARRTAGLAGLPYRPDALTTDVTYNMQLGMTEFGSVLNDWSGSLILAACAYNAGPGNARKWVAANGDPRAPGVDPIDWIEKIPFGETRNYVQRVLENAQVYRNRLAGRDMPLRILRDVYAPGEPRVRVLDYSPPPVRAPATAPVTAPR